MIPFEHPIRELGRRIKVERKQQNLTQTQLALLSGTSLNFISQLEAGKTTVRLDKALSVLQTIGLQLKIEYGRKGLV